MNALSKDSGLTLTELIIASMLIGVVLIGVASFTIVTSALEKSTFKGSILSMQVSAAMSQLKMDALLAVGDGSNEGVIAWEQNPTWIECEEVSPFTNMDYICFRHDVNLTPLSYADDEWQCYFLLVNLEQYSRELHRCNTMKTSDANGNILAAPENRCCAMSDQTNLVSIKVEDLLDIAFYKIRRDNDNRIDSIDLYITGVDDASYGSTYDPMTNPGVTMHTTVRPPGFNK